MKQFFVALLIVFVGAFVAPVAYAVNNCTGATYYDSDSDTCIACPAGYDYNTDAGKTDITQCQIHCDAGTYVEMVSITGYTQLAYIESSGTQYINTGVSGLDAGDWEIYVKWMLTGNSSNYARVVGAATDGNSNAYEIDHYVSGSNYLVYGNTGYQRDNGGVIVSGVAARQIHTGLIKNGSVTIDGVKYNPIIREIAISSTSPVYVLGSGFVGRIYSSWAKKDGAYKYNYIPARRDSDGVIGMYDTVTDTFFENAGTGTFTAGPDVGMIGGQCVNVGNGYWTAESVVNWGSIGTRNACPAGTYSDIETGSSASSCKSCTGTTYSMGAAAQCTSCPAGYTYNTEAGKTDVTQCKTQCFGGTYVEKSGVTEYTQLEYIESSGTQYINTGVSGLDAGDWEIYVKWMLTGNSSNYARVVGAATDGNSNAYEIDYYASGSNYLVYGNTGYQRDNGGVIVSGVAARQIHTGLIKNGSVTIDGVKYNTPTKGKTIGSTSPIYVLGSGFIGRIYSSWAKKDGAYKYNYIPARRDSDGVIGMYDTVTGTFFTNSGTGTFIAGPAIGLFGGECVNVGAGYYAAASTTNFGSLGTRTACPAGLTTVGYGHGADSANDCARTLHVGDYVLYARRDKITTPSLNIAVPNEGTYYVSLSPTDHSLSRLHVSFEGTKYTAYDDSLSYGERDFDTGQQITQ